MQAQVKTWGNSQGIRISKEILKPHDLEVHHKKPRQLGGTDEYENIVWINRIAHKLIHATKQETIEKMAPSVGEAAGTVAKGIKKGLKDEK